MILVIMLDKDEAIIYMYAKINPKLRWHMPKFKYLLLFLSINISPKHFLFPSLFDIFECMFIL